MPLDESGRLVTIISQKPPKETLEVLVCVYEADVGTLGAGEEFSVKLGRRGNESTELLWSYRQEATPIN